MRLLQIHEPGQTPDLHEEGRGYVVGIDLGTTNSVVAYSEEQMPRTLSSESGASLLPSIVSFQEDLQPKVGEASSPLTIRSVKRLMGLGRKELEQLQSSHSFHLSEDISEDDSLVYLKVGDRRVTPQEVSAEILRDLKKRAEVQLEGNVDRCVLTVPAHFDEAARKATKDAAKLAGMEVLRLINEPTAAALAYGLENGVEGIYAVYDLGGGTFDVSLLKLQKGVFQVLATGGDPALGGDDFDVFVLDSLLELHGKRSKDFAPSTVSSFLSIVRCGKEELTSRDVCHVSFPLPEGEIKCSLSRSKLEELISDSVERTLKICREVLQTVSLNPAEVQGVILVGGSTRIPYVQKAVSKCFEQDPYGNVNPDEVVA
ncbi:MAG: Hsp70 family protein, partial [Alphaproteobacteria bacterium]|nr:Hsp70 family protein [Alphaproteobacteria bacterium]